MQTRHRIPTIFSIYMVDVLCCALGCVVLLWQVNFQEAEEQTVRANEKAALAKQQTALAEEKTALAEEQAALAKEQAAAATSALERLAKAKLYIKSLDDSLAERTKELDDSKKRVVRLTLDLDELRQDRDTKLNLALVMQKKYDDALKAEAQLKALLEEKILDLSKNLADLSKKNTDLAQRSDENSKKSAAELAEQLRQNLDLSKKIKEAQLRLAGLEKDLAARQGEVAAAVRRVDDQKILLVSADADKRKLQAELDEMRIHGKLQLARIGETTIRSSILESDLDRTRKDLLAISKQYQELIQAHAVLSNRLNESGKDLDITKTMANKLKDEKQFLLNQAAKMRHMAESRFAGIALTGQRVVFLVDMSGSMELVDENTLDPDKWPEVANTVGKIMQSLPDLKQYQVILFSDKVRYIMGTEGKWIDYDAERSAKATVDAIKSIKPKGGTNMHSAFMETFRFRSQGLDTVYFFSDGLPTSGEGLPADRSKLTDTQITDILGQYIRKSLKNVWNRPLLNQPRVRINTIGFFFESPEVGAFLWALAREHDGSFVGMSKP